MSIPMEKGFKVAQERRAWAGADWRRWVWLYCLPKRHLIEIALHQAALICSCPDNPTDPAILARLVEEHDALISQGLI